MKNNEEEEEQNWKNQWKRIGNMEKMTNSEAQLTKRWKTMTKNWKRWWKNNARSWKEKQWKMIDKTMKYHANNETMKIMKDNEHQWRTLKNKKRMKTIKRTMKHENFCNIIMPIKKETKPVKNVEETMKAIKHIKKTLLRHIERQWKIIMKNKFWKTMKKPRAKQWQLMTNDGKTMKIMENQRAWNNEKERTTFQNNKKK